VPDATRKPDVAANPGDARTAALNTSADALAHAASLDVALNTILTAAASAIGADRAAVFLQDPDRPAPELVATLGMDADQVASWQEALGNQAHPVVEAARTRIATYDRRGDAESGAVHADLPLVVSRDGIDRPVGGMSFAWGAARSLDEPGKAFLHAIAHLAAVAIERFRLASLIAERSDWFERLAHTDPLTGLANQRTLARVLELELARAGRQGGEVSVALFDVDDFGATNASAGHEAGDDLLRAVAAVVSESVRLVDTVARFGGDEFVLVAPGPAGITVARRVLAGVAALPDVAGRRPSVSVGVARFPADGTSADELLLAAQRALTTARDAGPGTLSEAKAQPTA
jgi:diguanylate cyclase (GGDEF)-like protein